MPLVYSNKFIYWLKEEQSLNYDAESNKFYYCKDCIVKEYTLQALYFYFFQFVAKAGDF